MHLRVTTDSVRVLETKCRPPERPSPHLQREVEDSARNLVSAAQRRPRSEPSTLLVMGGGGGSSPPKRIVRLSGCVHRVTDALPSTAGRAKTWVVPTTRMSSRHSIALGSSAPLASGTRFRRKVPTMPSYRYSGDLGTLHDTMGMCAHLLKISPHRVSGAPCHRASARLYMIYMRDIVAHLYSTRAALSSALVTRGVPEIAKCVSCLPHATISAGASELLTTA